MTAVIPRPVEVHRLGVVALAVVLVLHGVAHFDGFTYSLQPGDTPHSGAR
jgi:hypothetical protein